MRRVLDGRSRIILPDGGLHLTSAVYAENAAAALLFCVDNADSTHGRALNVSDEVTPTLRQVVDTIASTLGHAFEVIDLPFALATPAHPLVMRSTPFHRYTPADALHALGHRDVVPWHDGLAATARWLAANPLERGTAERNLQDPFDYAAEDALIEAWLAAEPGLLALAARADPLVIDRYAPDREAQRDRRRATLRARRGD